MKRAQILILLLFLCQCIYTQVFNPEIGKLYDDSEIPKIYIQLAPLSLDSLYEPGSEESDHYYSAQFIFQNQSNRDTVNEVGFRFRGNTSRQSAKKSFKISFDAFKPGRKFKGVEKLNINGEHNDPSISRSKLSWDLMRSMNIPSSRCNHVELYINQEYYGLYLNVEHVDEEFVKTRFGPKHGNLFKCLYPADLNYLGSNPENYKLSFNGRRVYELKTHEDEDDYTAFAHFVAVLNNTPIDDLPCELEAIFNVNTYLKAIAVDVLIGNWDGPIFNKNNFYLYQDSRSGKFQYIPYDLDNTFGIDWFGIDWANRNIYNWSSATQSRPLYRRILQVQEYRNRFSYYMQQLLDKAFNPGKLNPKLDDFKSKLFNSVSNDPLYEEDYGYSLNDFQNSFVQSLFTDHTPYGLKPYIQQRFSSAKSQNQVNSISPVLTNLNAYSSSGFYFFQVDAFDDTSIEEIQLCWLNSIGQQGCHIMQDDGNSNDGINNDGTYGTPLISIPGTGEVMFYVEVKELNSPVARLPYCDYEVLTRGTFSSSELVINELMASNDNVYADEEGEFDDWIELFNKGTDPVYLGDKYLSDKPENPIKWQFPDIWIEGGEYLVLWADEDGEQGLLHTNFKLNASGEQLGIYHNDFNANVVIDEVVFPELDRDEAYGRLPNGSGGFQLVLPTPGFQNQALSNLNEADNVEKFKVFPNPFRNVINIENFQLSDRNQNLDIRLYDMLGRQQIINISNSNGLVQIRGTQQLINGVYNLVLIENHEIIYQKRIFKL